MAHGTAYAFLRAVLSSSMVTDGKAQPSTLEDLFAHAERIDDALARSYLAVAQLHKRMGIPVAVYREGRVVLIPPEQILVPGERGLLR